MTFNMIFESLFDTYADRYRAKDAAGCASVFASDAELYSPYGPPAIGRDAIEAIHRDWVEEGSEAKEIRVVDAGADGNLGWCLARYSEGSAEDDGTSLNVLERQRDGTWLITRCSLNES